MAALRLVLASGNAKKLAELRTLLGSGADMDDVADGADGAESAGHAAIADRSSGGPGPAALPLELVPQGALGIAEAEEPHGTFLENALAKARQAARAAGGPAIADDSGLCVDALGGAPGVASAHWAGALAAAPGEDREALRRRQDAANNALLLQRLATVADRRARFVCTLVALRHADDPEPLVATGRWAGTVLAAPQGQGGFGYDPLLFIPALGASVAALAPAVKNRHSHRAQAARAMAALLRAHWLPGG